jgi:hypothetical protein
MRLPRSLLVSLYVVAFVSSTASHAVSSVGLVQRIHW